MKNKYFSLYKMMYNDNKYFYYTKKCISIYMKMYNDNKYFYYTR